MSRGRGLALLAAAAAALAAGAAGCGGQEAPPPATTATTPQVERLRIVFPEGFTRAEMAVRVGEVRRIAIARRGVTPRLTGGGYLQATGRLLPPIGFRKEAKGRIEGFLFPATYEFTQLTPARRLAADQLRTFREKWARVDLRYARSKKLTPYDVLIIASMIEEETAVAEERRLVAAVVYNRLRAGMPLGIDAAVRYGVGRPGTESLRQSDLRSDSPYNTRRFTGLPPTPISNPGLASMQAAARPADVPYLYYVRRPGSLRHFFTADESAFLRKVCEYGYGCD